MSKEIDKNPGESSEEQQYLYNRQKLMRWFKIWTGTTTLGLFLVLCGAPSAFFYKQTTSATPEAVKWGLVIEGSGYILSITGLTGITINRGRRFLSPDNYPPPKS